MRADIDPARRALCSLLLAAPFKVVDHTLRRAMERTHMRGLRFRPWLQAFKDYAFDRREFGEHEIRLQIDAAEGCGADGWMLWNPRNQYTGAGLNVEGAACKHDAPDVVQSPP